MLYLEAPFYFINGVSVYRDHADPLQYYYMPMSPRLRRIPDPATGRKVPQLQLIKYRSAVAGAGGFLNFDVHVGLEPEELDDLAFDLKRLARLDDRPRLAPVPLVDGSVRLLLFGQESATPAPPPRPGATASPAPAPAAATTVSTTTAASAPDQPRFVLKIDHAAKPSLYGDNQAAFSVQLDQYGTAILEQSMKGEMSPVAVVYSLDYLALRPAFSVRLHIDWDRVQSFMDETFGHEGLFDSEQIENAVDKLVDSRIIVMEADDFVPDAEDQGATAERFRAAQSRVQDMITDGFFQASLPPMKERPDGWDKAKDVITDVNRMVEQTALTGGIGAIIGTFSYKKENYTRMDHKRLDVTISERTAVRRTIYPQGHLAGLFRVLRDGDDPSRYILSVDADDPWFQRRRVRVISRADLQADGIGSVQALLRYGGQPKDVLLDKPDAEAELSWASIVENGAVKPEVEASFTVNFKGGDRSERPTTVSSKPATVLGEAFELRPRELYSLVRIPVLASPNYPWDRYPQVQVELRYQDAANGIRMDDMLLLDAKKTAGDWQIFVLDPAKRTFEYKLLHRAADNRDIESAWQASERELVDVRDPVPPGNRLRLDVMPVVRWDDIEQVFVDLAYDDPANDVHVESSLTFSPTDRGPKSFVADIKDRERRAVGFKVTTIMKGGILLEVPPSMTEEARLLVRPDMKAKRIVAVRPPADFVARGLEKVTAELRYADDANGLSFADKFDFGAAGALRKFSFDIADPARTRFSWRADFLFQSGLMSATDWAEADATELDIRAP
jgi:hypothetical protein